MKNSIIDDIAKSLEGPLPGQEVQFQMASAFRYNRMTPPPDATNAAVLLLLYPNRRKDDWHMVFIERMSNNLNDHHRGQISFPGGRYEEEDLEMSFTALREAEEEVGVPSDKVRLLGALTQLYVPVSGYLIHPFVGFISERPGFVPQQTEVNRILEAPLESLRDVTARKVKDILTPSNLKLKDVPYFELEGQTIWGATAMILNEFLHIDPLRSA